MIHLTDNDQSVVALIYNNILLLPGGEVIGVLLGNCVFGIDGQVKGRYFKHTLFTLEGRVLARHGESQNKFTFSTQPLVESAWLLLMKIKDHTCPEVAATTEWVTKSVKEHFITSKSI